MITSMDNGPPTYRVFALLWLVATGGFILYLTIASYDMRQYLKERANNFLDVELGSDLEGCIIEEEL